MDPNKKYCVREIKAETFLQVNDLVEDDETDAKSRPNQCYCPSLIHAQVFAFFFEIDLRQKRHDQHHPTHAHTNPEFLRKMYQQGSKKCDPFVFGCRSYGH